MATVIKASCHDCGDVELGVNELSVRVCAEPTQSSYVFRCPTCQMSVCKPAEQRIVDLLVASGVELIKWELPDELFEIHDGQAITYDDLIDFHALLQTESWFDTVVALGASG